MEPTRCFSSMLTTELLKYRNPQGAEENWFNGGDRIESVPNHLGKVITTEIGSALLCVTAIIETIAYSILCIGSLCLLIGTLPLSYFYTQPYEWNRWLGDSSFSRLPSSAFTILWNFTNLTAFNFWCTNLFTDESLVRYSMDHCPRGQIYKLVVDVTEIALVILSKGEYRPGLARIIDNRGEGYLRSEDILYIAEWARAHRVGVTWNEEEMRVINPLLGSLVRFVSDINDSIEEGANYFNDYILDSDEIDALTKEKIRDYDPEIYMFVLTRAMYGYVFGPRRDEMAPTFFKPETRQLIDKLREKYAEDKGAQIEALMQDISLFDQEQSDPDIKEILKDIKEAASSELQHSLFVTKCWQKACTELHPKELHAEEEPIEMIV